MDDCDIDLAVEATWASRVIYSGQVCNCAERVYVQNSIADEFIDKLVKKMASTKVVNTNVASCKHKRLRVTSTKSCKLQAQKLASCEHKSSEHDSSMCAWGYLESKEEGNWSWR